MTFNGWSIGGRTYGFFDRSERRGFRAAILVDGRVTRSVWFRTKREARLWALGRFEDEKKKITPEQKPVRILLDDLGVRALEL